MAGFRSYQDFYGSYSGSYDGRNAQLRITDLKDDSPFFNFHIVFTDRDRNEVYMGTPQEQEDPGHRLTNITLNREGGEGAITWRELLLHTWDVSYLSGTSVWNATDFGMSFKRN